MNEFDAQFYQLIGQKLRRLRKENGYTLERVARMNDTTTKTIQRYEKGERKVAPAILKTLVESLGGNYDQFVAEVQNDRLPPVPDAFPVNPTHKIPLLGQIAAGVPIYAEENIEGYLWTDRNHGAEYFGLRVRGDSMNAARINDGDIVIVKKQDIVEDGEIAVVLVDDCATIKRYHREGDMVILTPQSTNPVNQVQFYNLKEHSIQVLGRVVESRTEY